MKLDFFFPRIILKMFFHLIYEIGLNFNLLKMWVVQFHSVTQLCLTLCDPRDYSPLGFPVHHQLLELAQTHVHRVCDATQPVHPKGKQSWIFIGRTDAEAEASILWLPDAKNWLIGKDPDAGKYWRQEKGMTEDEMVGWHHWLNGHEFEQAPGVGDGLGSVACCSP